MSSKKETPLSSPKNLKNAQVLFVCPSDSWGTLERGVLRDCQIISSLGGVPFLFCLDDSFLHNEAKDKKIVCFTHKKGKEIKSPLSWSFYFEIRDILKKQSISFVHCYQLINLWALCLLLKRRPFTPLVYSHFKETGDIYKSFIHRMLLSRVDLIFVPTSELIYNVLDTLPFKRKKIEVRGLGIKVQKKFSHHQSETWSLGCLLETHLKNLRPVIPLIYAAQALKEELGDGFRVLLISEKDWQTFYLYKPIKEKVEEMGLEEVVFFHDTQELESALENIDVWISLEKEISLSDSMALSLCHEIPAVAPRSAFLPAWFHQQLAPVETYSPGDARELKDKCLKIINNYKDYRSRARKISSYVQEFYGYDFYEKALNKFYLRVALQRYRLFKRKKKKSRK